MFNDLIPFNRHQNSLENFFNRFFDDSFITNYAPSAMKVDIKDNGSEYILEAEMPGANKEQIKVEYENNYLTIGMEDLNEVKEEKENYIRRERSSRKISRSFYIENINNETISASYENGILKITLPKDNKAEKKKSIEIQ